MIIWIAGRAQLHQRDYRVPIRLVSLPVKSESDALRPETTFRCARVCGRLLHARVGEAAFTCPAGFIPKEGDPTRLYLGGISAGGTMTNRALAFDSDFWAGGMPISGEWYVTADEGSYLDFASVRAAVKPAPTKIFQGRAGPFPLNLISIR
jgi:hypothetical protein